jgi:hypothetical protein
MVNQFLARVPRKHNREKKVSSINGARKTMYPHMTSLDPYTIQKNLLKMTEDLNIRPETTKLLKYTRNKPLDIVLDNDCF